MTVDGRQSPVTRGLLRDADLTPEGLRYVVDLAAELKRARRSGAERPALAGRHVALLFEKPSTRTRCAFEVAAADQGARVTYLDPASIHLSERESVADTARVLRRLFDGIGYRTRSQSVVDDLAAHAGIAVWNALSDQADAEWAVSGPHRSTVADMERRIRRYLARAVSVCLEEVSAG